MGAVPSPARPSRATPTPPRTPPPWLNRLMGWLLQSPLSRFVDDSLLLLTVTGRRTGRRYTFPVQYVADGEDLWITSGAGAEKTWWRNLVSGAPVELLLRRTRYRGHATAHTWLTDPEQVRNGLRLYVARYPSMGKRLGITVGDAQSLEEAVEHNVMVRVRGLQPMVPGGAS